MQGDSKTSKLEKVLYREPFRAGGARSLLIAFCTFLYFRFTEMQKAQRSADTL